MWRLGKMRHAAAEAVLEKYAAHPLHPDQEKEALDLLRRFYPTSWYMRGVREYEAICQRTYFGGFWSYEMDTCAASLPPEAVPKLRDWLQRYPYHPGRDDAFLRLGVELEPTRPLEALKALYDGFDAPDGDKRILTANWFQRILERVTSVEDLEGWLEEGCPGDVRDNVLYAMGLKRMRQHRFLEALSLFERSVRARLPPAEEPRMTGWWAPGPVDGWIYCTSERRKEWSYYDHIDAQVALCRWFASREDVMRTAAEAEAHASILHEMGRRCFKEEGAFVNFFYYPVLFRDPPGKPIRVRSWEHDDISSMEDIHLGNHYRQAWEFFRQIAREHPSYSQIEAVEYSIPLCVWRVARSWPALTRWRLEKEIASGFQAFADKYPGSTMADDALYAAGVSDWTASGKTDPSVIRRNMMRIAADYPDGNIVHEYARQVNAWREPSP